jgi:hypothetical protein
VEAVERDEDVDVQAPLRRDVPRELRGVHSKGAFNLLLDGTYDQDVDIAMREMDAEKRARLTHDLGQKLWEGYHGVMLGMKAITWATTRKVGAWPTLAYTVAETNYEYITVA